MTGYQTGSQTTAVGRWDLIRSVAPFAYQTIPRQSTVNAPLRSRSGHGSPNRYLSPAVFPCIPGRNHATMVPTPQPEGPSPAMPTEGPDSSSSGDPSNLPREPADLPANLPTLLLRVRQYDFTIPRRYHPGQTITTGEAYALNQIMVENIRNNTDPWIRKAEAKARAESGFPDATIPPDELASLQARILDYATKYRFQPRTKHRPLSSVELALDELAISQATTEGRQRGLSPDSTEVKLRYRQLLSDPDLHNRAREIVAERAKIAHDAVSDLLDEDVI